MQAGLTRSIAIALILAATSCQRQQPNPSEPMRKAEANALLLKWQRCAAELNTQDAVRSAQADAKAGEWRFLTYHEYGLGGFDDVPGVDKCESLLPPGHDRAEQISSCGEVGGGPERSFDCECQTAERKYRAAYNAIILKSVPNARSRNCTANGLPLEAQSLAKGPASGAPFK